MESPQNPFPETADIETSSDDYASRFSGPTGEWMLKVQEEIVLSFLRNTPGASVLDVGGGHGQLAGPLCRDGYPVTVLGSDESCRRRIAAIVDSGKCVFKTGNVIGLPFADKSFDFVLCFRLVTHCGKWPKLIEELCRVAKCSVIIDYPTSQSLNKVSPALFSAKKKMEGNTRTWRLFRHDEINAEFARHGFAPSRRRGQFFLPMVLHRALKCRPLSQFLEACCRAVGLARGFGSPVIVEFQRAQKE